MHGEVVARLFRSFSPIRDMRTARRPEGGLVQSINLSSEIGRSRTRLPVA